MNNLRYKWIKECEVRVRMPARPCPSLPRLQVVRRASLGKGYGKVFTYFSLNPETTPASLPMPLPIFSLVT